jgi:hypothetical protein
MSATWNGREMYPHDADSPAERLGRLIENGVRKLGLKDLEGLRVDPTKCKDVIWCRTGSTAGRAGRVLTNYPDVRGLTVVQIAARHGLTMQVAGRLLAMQSMQLPSGGSAK